MEPKELIERYVTLVAALFCMSLGIALSIHAALGITPISCPPYVLSLGLRPSVGQFTIAMHVIMVLMQVALLRKDFPKIQYLQLAMAFIFGFFIDAAVWLTGWVVPQTYVGQLLLVVVGSGVLAFGITLEVVANVMYIAGEGLTLALSKVLRKPFGHLKIGFDCTLIAISLVFSWILFKEIRGVREGTIISALLVGFFVGRIQPHMAWLSRFLARRSAVTQTTRPEYTIVTIGRQFGSGGHEIGEKLARRLGWKFYDRQLINLTVERSGLSTHYVERHEQQLSAAQSIWRDIMMDNIVPADDRLSPDDRLFVAQSKLVRSVAAEGPCVIVGRCGDYILKDNQAAFHIFVTSTPDFACKRVEKEYHYDTEKAMREITRINKMRANHYKYYTRQTWGDPRHYDLYLKSSSLGIDGAVDTIERIIKRTK